MLRFGPARPLNGWKRSLSWSSRVATFGKREELCQTRSSGSGHAAALIETRHVSQHADLLQERWRTMAEGIVDDDDELWEALFEDQPTSSA